jgi:anti-sigma B factor antagonist
LSASLPVLSVCAVPDRARVCVLAAGDLDLSTCSALRRQLDELLDVGWTDVTVDLREVDFIDSAGLHVLLEAERRARDAGSRLVVVADPGPVTALLDLTATAAALSVA